MVGSASRRGRVFATAVQMGTSRPARKRQMNRFCMGVGEMGDGSAVWQVIEQTRCASPDNSHRNQLRHGSQNAQSPSTSSGASNDDGETGAQFDEFYRKSVG